MSLCIPCASGGFREQVVEITAEEVFPAQAGVIPKQQNRSQNATSIPRASGGDPDQDDNNAELSRYSPICGDDLNLGKVGRLSNFVVLAYGE